MPGRMSTQSESDRDATCSRCHSATCRVLGGNIRATHRRRNACVLRKICFLCHRLPSRPMSGALIWEATWLQQRRLLRRRRLRRLPRRRRWPRRLLRRRLPRRLLRSARRLRRRLPRRLLRSARRPPRRLPRRPSRRLLRSARRPLRRLLRKPASQEAGFHFH